MADMRNGSSVTEWQVTANSNDVSLNADKPYSPDGEDQELIKVVLLGAPGVGKTAIVQQFVRGTFESAYYPTGKKETYYPSVIHHDRKYDLKIVEIPDIPFFPVSSFYNISDLKASGLRDASAYILVFDLLCPDSFDYVSGMFTQINEGRDLGRVPVVVVGNKTDKVNDNIYKSRLKSRRDSDERKDHWEHDDHGHHNGGHHGYGGHDELGGGAFGHHRGHGGHEHGFGHFGSGFGHHFDYFGGSKKKHSKEKKHAKHGFQGHHGSSSFGSFDSHHGGRGHEYKRGGRDKYSKQHSYEINWANTYTPDEYLDKDIADKVTTEWKAIYKECSARDPEAVTDVFKSVMGVFEEVGVGRYDSDRDQHDHERLKPCTIL